ncbi:DUF397 domain-containing protein [Streptosporangium sp. NPDC023615]|uniref:DUF397 domain-containing protein n=1 Tax=Streptosporangium sp. NPDC023615 TaxID=3154794 RepID=UPI003418BE87
MRTVTSSEFAGSPDLPWRASSFCNNGSCVEVARLPNGGMAVRDNKLGDDSPVLRFTPREWESFVESVRSEIP